MANCASAQTVTWEADFGDGPSATCSGGWPNVVVWSAEFHWDSGGVPVLGKNHRAQFALQQFTQWEQIVIDENGQPVPDGSGGWETETKTKWENIGYSAWGPSYDGNVWGFAITEAAGGKNLFRMILDSQIRTGETWSNADDRPISDTYSFDCTGVGSADGENETVNSNG